MVLIVRHGYTRAGPIMKSIGEQNIWFKNDCSVIGMQRLNRLTDYKSRHGWWFTDFDFRAPTCHQTKAMKTPRFIVILHTKMYFIICLDYTCKVWYKLDKVLLQNSKVTTSSVSFPGSSVKEREISQFICRVCWCCHVRVRIPNAPCECNFMQLARMPALRRFHRQRDRCFNDPGYAQCLDEVLHLEPMYRGKRHRGRLMYDLIYCWKCSLPSQVPKSFGWPFSILFSKSSIAFSLC